MLPSLLDRKIFAVESKFLRILSIVASYVRSKCRALPRAHNTSVFFLLCLINQLVRAHNVVFFVINFKHLIVS